jgi:magnesium chelatase subunit D
LIKQKFPFAAVVGLNHAKHALMLLAVDPGLKGTLIIGPSGTGKSFLARCFWSIFPEEESPEQESGRIGISRSRIDGKGRVTEEGGPIAAGRAAASDEAGRLAVRSNFEWRSGSTAPFIEIPVSATEDMLLGGVDVGLALVEGGRRLSSGLLSKADGGFVSVDGIDLLEWTNLRHVLAALDSGVVMIERDGFSTRHHARFALIGTMNTWDNQTAVALKDRVGLIIEGWEAPTESDRTDILDRADRFIMDPAGFCDEFEATATELRNQVREARGRLSSISIGRSDISRISATAVSLGINSSRADLFAVRAARASAAFRGAPQVGEADVMAAIEYVLLPRATTGEARQGVRAEPLTGSDLDLASDQMESREERFPAAAPSTADCGASEAGQLGDAAAGVAHMEGGNVEKIHEVVLRPKDCSVPSLLTNAGLAPRSIPKGRARTGRRAQQIGGSHGRYVGAVPAAGGPVQGRRVAIEATLRAAAPYQKLRRAASYSGPAENKQQRGDGPETSKCSERLIIKPSDLRLKRLKHRTGALFIFLVDSSGSMGVGRIGHAKGVMIRMLRQSYLRRDSVALIAFRGTSVEAILEPTSSMEVARRAIESMPAGGGTPLAAGLASAISLAERARRKTPRKPILLIFTDGRVNVPLKTPEKPGRTERERVIRAELEALGRRLREETIRAVVVDTSPWNGKDGGCASISAAIGAKYCRLEQSRPDGLYEQIREFTAKTGASQNEGALRIY